MLYSRNCYVPQTRRKLSRGNINNSPVKGYALRFVDCYYECYANRKLLTVVLIASAIEGPLVSENRDCDIYARLWFNRVTTEFLEL